MNRTLISVVLISWGCGGPAFENLDAAGGTSTSGGDTSGDGGTTANGGTTAKGGATGTGGSDASGGANSAGGKASTGGANGTGGKASTGGVTSTGGTSSSGGTNSTGGSGKGGSTNTGGITGSGGTTSTGGITSMGGTPSTGGTTSMGGTPSTGGTTSSGGTIGTGGTNSGGTGGLGGMTCDQLRERYRVVLGQAQACEPVVPESCTEQVKSDLFCGCTTFASTQHPSALEELKALVKEASTRMCAVVCPAIKCIEPVGAACTPSATTGMDTAYACKVGIATTTN